MVGAGIAYASHPHPTSPSKRCSDSEARKIATVKWRANRDKNKRLPDTTILSRGYGIWNCPVHGPRLGRPPSQPFSRKTAYVPPRDVLLFGCSGRLLSALHEVMQAGHSQRHNRSKSPLGYTCQCENLSLLKSKFVRCRPQTYAAK